MQEEQPDETNEFGRYTPAHEPLGEDELYAVILALVQQDCGTKDADKLDSWAISAYAHPSPYFDATTAVGKSPVAATASANFSINGVSRCSGMFGIRS